MKKYPHKVCIHNEVAEFCQIALWVSLFLFAVAQPILSQQDMPEELQGVFVKGVQALKEGQLDTAEKAFTQVLRQGGRLPFVYNNLGIVYQQRGEHTEAVAQFREALRLQPNYAAPRILLGSSLLALGKVSEATRELERAIKLQPTEPLARLPLAMAYERIGNLAGAVEQYRVMRELAPKDPEYAYHLGKAYLRLSVWSLDQMKRLNPRSARVYQILGENYRLQGHLDSALQAFRKASQGDPKLLGIHLAMAEILLEQEKKSAALTEIDQELILAPESKVACEFKQKIEAAGVGKN